MPMPDWIEDFTVIKNGSARNYIELFLVIYTWNYTECVCQFLLWDSGLCTYQDCLNLIRACFYI